MKNALRCLLVPAVAAACALPVAADASVDVFLKIEGIPGESTAHKDQIEVLSWSWGMAQQFGPSTGMRAAKGTGCITELNLMKLVDKATPKLMGALVSGTMLKNAKLSLHKAGGDKPLEFLTIEMETVFVSSLQESGSSESPTESLALRFAKATVTHTQQKQDGSIGDKTPVTIQAPNC